MKYINLSFFLFLLILHPSQRVYAEEVDIANKAQLLALRSEEFFLLKKMGVTDQAMSDSLAPIAQLFCTHHNFTGLVSFQWATQTSSGLYSTVNRSGPYLIVNQGVQFIPLSWNFYYIGTADKPIGLIDYPQYVQLQREKTTPVFEESRRPPEGGIYFKELICSRPTAPPQKSPPQVQINRNASAFSSIATSVGSPMNRRSGNTLIEEHEVNLLHFPSSVVEGDSDSRSEITLGDLHGNALKLVHFLVREGVLRVSKDDYYNWVNLYRLESAENKTQLKEIHLSSLNDWLQRVEVVKVGPKVRFLGDLLCDRGANDYFTLKILEKLVTGGRKIEIILSNHDLGFLYFYQALKTTPLPFSKDPFADLNVRVAPNLSLFRLIHLITRYPSLKDEVQNIVKSVFLPVLRLFEIGTDRARGQITLFSHAYVGLEAISALSEIMGDTPCSIELLQHDLTLKACVLRMNSKLQEQFRSESGISSFLDLLRSESDIFDRHNASPPGELGDVQTPDQMFPLHYAVWNREPGSPDHFRSVIRPKSIGHYTAKYVHGHVGEIVPISEGNLDTHLGKGQSADVGTYRIHAF